MIKGHWSAHSNFQWSASGDAFITVTTKDVVQFFEEPSGKDTHLVRIPDEYGSILGMVATSTGDRVFTFTPRPARLCEWDGSTGKLINERVWEDRERVLPALELSPDGRYLLAAGGFEFLVIDRQTDELRQWTVPTRINACTWHPDGQRLATAAINGTISLWSIQEEHSLGQLLGHSADAYELAWHPDGRRLGSTSADQTVKIWDTDNQQLVLTLRGHGGETRGLAWSPDGRSLATTSLDGSLRLWDATSAYEADADR